MDAAGIAFEVLPCGATPSDRYSLVRYWLIFDRYDPELVAALVDDPDVHVAARGRAAAAARRAR